MNRPAAPTPRESNPPPRPKRKFTIICGWCGKTATAESDRGRWCSDACKIKAYRHRQKKHA